MAIYVDAAAAAKLIRDDLKKAFPDVKFSVRTERYSGGASVDVTWTDGPAVNKVKAVVWKYRGRDSADITDYAAPLDYDDAVTGKTFHYGSNYVVCNRTYTVAFLAAIAQKVAKRWGEQAPAVEEGWKGQAFVKFSDVRIGDEWLSDMVVKEANVIDAN